MTDISIQIILSSMRAQIDSLTEIDKRIGIHEKYFGVAYEMGCLEWIREVEEDINHDLGLSSTFLTEERLREINKRQCKEN